MKLAATQSKAYPQQKLDWRPHRVMKLTGTGPKTGPRTGPVAMKQPPLSRLAWIGTVGVATFEA